MSNTSRSHEKGKNQPKKGSWSSMKSPQQKSVRFGISGFLFTCEGHEQAALNEARNLLVGLSVNDGEQEEGKDEEDVADTLARRPSTSSIIPQQQPTGVRNCLFMVMNGGEGEGVKVCAMAERLVNEAQHSSTCRFLQRVTPVEMTCAVDMGIIQSALSTIIARHFIPIDGQWPSFAVDYKARNNDRLNRDAVIEMVAQLVKAVSPLSRVKLDKPNKSIIVHVLRKTTFLAVADEFISRNRFSLHCKPI